MNRINHSSRFIEMFGNAENTKPLSACIGASFPGEWGEDDSDGTGVNVIRTTNFTNTGKLDLTNVVTRKIDQAKIDKKHLVPGDIILERSGGTADNPVGRVVYFEADGTFLFNNFTQLLRCKDGENSLFVFYSLYNYYHTHKSEIRSMGNKTTGIQNLKMDKYWDIPIADASPEQQEQFVRLYKHADKSKFNGFKSRFFEQFQGKGYQSQKLNSFAQVVTGSTPSRSVSDYWLNGTHPWVSAQDMGDKFVDATAELVSDSGMATCKLIPAGSLLYVCRGSIGVMSINRIDCATNQSICSAICDVSICKTEYLYYWLLYHEDEINSLGEGTSFKSLSQKTFASLEIQIPPIEEQLRFIEITRQADKSKFELKQAIEKIDKVMRALMQ